MISNEYAAGFFDGEGTVYAATRNSPKGKRPSPTIIVAITNTIPAPLELLHSRWGGSLFKDKERERQRSKYQWTLAAKMASPFLKAIRPHLLIKGDVVDVAIEICDLMALPHKERCDYSHTVFRHGRYWCSPVVRPEFRSKIEALHAEIRRLNVRGAPWNARREYTTANAV